MTNDIRPIGQINSGTVQNAQTINNNYYYNVPDSHYQDRLDLSTQQAQPNNPVILVYNAACNQVHAQANNAQAFLGGPNYSGGATQDAQLQQVFRECQAICDALTYGFQPQPQQGLPQGTQQIVQQGQQGMRPQVIIINMGNNGPLSQVQGLQNMTDQAIRDALAPLPAEGEKTEQTEETEKKEPTKKSSGLPEPDEKTAKKVKQAAIAIHDAIDGWGTDEDTVFQMLEGLSPKERAYLEVAYANLYGNGDPNALRNDLRGDLSGDDETKALSLMNEGALKDPMSAAIALHEAMDGIGTDEETVKFIMENSSPEFLQEVQENYDAMFNEDPNNPGLLRRDIQGDFSKWDDIAAGAGTGAAIGGVATGVWNGGLFSWVGASIGGLIGGITGIFTDSNAEDRKSLVSKLNRSITDSSSDD